MDTKDAVTMAKDRESRTNGEDLWLILVVPVDWGTKEAEEEYLRQTLVDLPNLSVHCDSWYIHFPLCE